MTAPGFLGRTLVTLALVAITPHHARGAGEPTPTTPSDLKDLKVGSAALADPKLTPASPPAPVDLRPAVRIQRRFVEKRHRLAVYAGFAWLGRGDFYRSPGVEVAASLYVIEPLAIDVRGAWLFSSPTGELTDLVNRTGYLPDSLEERATVLAGLRWSFGYAKIRLSEKLTLHFEPQLFLYGGVHVASGFYGGNSVGPMGEVGLGFLVFVTPRIQLRFDGGLTVEGEQRSKYVAVIGGYPVVSLGVMF